MAFARGYRALILSSALTLITGSTASAHDVPDSLRITGFVETSVQRSSADQNGFINGSLYGRRHEQFSLNMLMIGIDRPVALDRTMAGFTARLLYGASATPIRSIGLAIGAQANLSQAFVTFNRPTRSGSVQVSAGKIASLMGFEVMESVLNPNLSVGNQFIFLEDFTHVGIETNWNIDPAWSLRIAVINGWDVAVDNNTGKTVMGRLTWAPRKGSSVALLGYSGPEQPGNSRDLRSGGQMVAATPLGPTTATVQFDAGSEEGIDATWWGVGAWWVISLGRAGTLALRGDIVDDPNGARTSEVVGFPALDSQRLSSATVTFNFNPAADLMIRPEIRYDHSSRKVYDGVQEQVIIALGMALTY